MQPHWPCALVDRLSMQKLVGERVEVIGDEAEGFPASFSCAIIASKGDNLRVQYEDVRDSASNADT